jgi:hydroxyethylthiazole kinase-like sugar kinase family protein
MMTITQDPQTLSVLGAMAMMNMEGEGIGDVKSYFRKQLINMGVVTPTEKEAEEMALEAQNQQEDPNSVALRAMAEEAQAKAAKARADVVDTIADAGLKEARTAETEAKTMKTLADIDNNDEYLTLEALKNM